MARRLITCLLALLPCACGDGPPLVPGPLANDFSGPAQVAALAEALDIPRIIEGPGGMRFRLVPAGRFEMGRGPGHALREIQLHSPYYIQEGEVTWGHRGAVRETDIVAWGPNDLPGEAPDPASPWTNVSHDEAVRFAGVVAKMMKRHVRLPREAEWEFACRAGSGLPYWSGATPPPLPPGGGSGPLAPSAYPANALGLRAMHGNVSEWCGDWFGPYPPHATSDPVGPHAGTLRVVRGGSWSSGHSQQSSGARGGREPGTQDPQVGFRLVVESGYHGRVPLEITGVRLDSEGRIAKRIPGLAIEVISIPERLADRQAGIPEEWTPVEAHTPTTLMMRPGRYYARLIDAAGRRGLELKIDIAAPGPVAVNLVVPRSPDDD